MALAMILLPAGDAVAKHLTAITGYGAGFLAWSRFVVGLALVAPAAAAGGQLRGLDAMFLVRQALRGGLVAGAIVFVINAVKTAPLADVYGAFFVGPTAAVVLARLLLHEPVRPLEWVAVLQHRADADRVHSRSRSMPLGMGTGAAPAPALRGHPNRTS